MTRRFDSQAAEPFTAGERPYAEAGGPPQTERFLQRFDARFHAGTWTLQVTDNCPGDSGRILDFTLHFLPR